MSYLQKQQKDFAAGLGGVASRMSGPKRPPPSPSPSVTSTTSAAAGAAPGSTSGTTPTKKIKRETATIVYSQPENTGVGEELGSNILYIVEYLKKEGKARTLRDILAHTGLNKRDDSVQRTIKDRLKLHTRVKYIEDPEGAAKLEPGHQWRAGRFEHLPIIPGVRDAASLLAFLRRRSDASGVSVKDLKDGWPDCEDAIARLEAEHKLLVVRTKKDQQARTVWLDDPVLFHEVDQEFVATFKKVEVPTLEDIVRRLTAVGQKPTSEDPRLKVNPNADKKKQKKRAQRRTGKMTNTHMEHLLKDYSHLKK